jgi:hypothetical protein
MKDKKYTRKYNSDGSETLRQVDGNVNFFAPFSLLKKDYKLPSSNLNAGIKPILTTIEILKSINQDNRISTAAINQIGLQFDMKKTAVNNLISSLSQVGILIKISQGLYKVHEDLVIFKQDHAGYLALQKETQTITTNTQNITNNINIMNPSETLLAKLLAKGAKINSQNASDIEEF